MIVDSLTTMKVVKLVAFISNYRMTLETLATNLISQTKPIKHTKLAPSLTIHQSHSCVAWKVHPGGNADRKESTI